MTSLGNSSTKTIQIVGGASGVTFTSPNTFTLQLPASGYQTGKDECALKNLTLYYSWPNISATLGNNSFSYRFNGTTYPVVLADGIYSFADIQDYLELVMFQNGHYLVNASGKNVFYLAMDVNPVLYCLSLTATPVPDTLPSGYTNPADMELTGLTMQMIIPAGFTQLTGFGAASYPSAPQVGLYQVNSGIPQITSVSVLNVTSSMVTSSGLSLYPNVLASFVVPSDQSPGSLIQIQPYNADWVPVIRTTTLTTIEVSIVDQLMRPIQLRDIAGFVATINVRRQA